jgi:hypothetical protein
MTWIIAVTGCTPGAPGSHPRTVPMRLLIENHEKFCFFERHAYNSPPDLNELHI